MLTNIVLPWVHYVSVLLMAGMALTELYLFKLKASDETLKLLGRVDRFYGIFAVLVLVTGLLRVWHGGKGADYYWHNAAFLGVIALFIIGSLSSAVPTIRIMRWRKAVAAGGALPAEGDMRKTRVLVHAQLTTIVLMALLITVVARGYGVAAAR
jgi:putative membrane protein